MGERADEFRNAFANLSVSTRSCFFVVMFYGRRQVFGCILRSWGAHNSETTILVPDSRSRSQQWPIRLGKRDVRDDEVLHREVDGVRHAEKTVWKYFVDFWKHTGKTRQNANAPLPGRGKPTKK